MKPEDLRLQARTLRRLAEELEATADSLVAPSASEILDLAALREVFGFSRESLLSAATKGLAVHRGPRGRLCAFRSDVEAWIRSRAWTPPKARAEETTDEALARAEAELFAGAGCNTRRKSRKSLDSEEQSETPDGSESGFKHLRRVK